MSIDAGNGAAFRADGLSKSFDSHAVLNNLNLAVPCGAAVGLLGANGAGKSTLIKLLLGLMEADAGRCTVAGEPSRALSPAVRQRLGYVPQMPGSFAWLTGRQMLRYVAAFYPFFDWPYVDTLLDRWKISVKTPIFALSPGQQQRLSIVRALGSRPELLVLDEPIASLDPVTRLSVIDELIQQRAQRPLTILFSSHITHDLSRLCSHFVVLAQGKAALNESVQRCTDLLTLVIGGEELELEDLIVADALLIRRAAVGERRITIDCRHRERLIAGLPNGCRVIAVIEDLEVVLSEWMS